MRLIKYAILNMMNKKLANQINCIIDARVSTAKQLDGNGLVEQKLACEYYVKSRGWNVKKIYSKTYSGAAEHRADFEEIKEYIRTSQKKGAPIHYYVFRSIDRLTRLGPESLARMKSQIQALGVELVDTEGIIQPVVNTLAHHGVSFDWSMRSPSAMAELVKSQTSAEERTQILTRLFGAEVGLEKEGYNMRASLDGYRNARQMIEGKDKSVLAQDPERATYRKMMYEMRASGLYTDKEIVDHVNALGYRSKPQKRWRVEGGERRCVGESTPKLMTVKQLQKSIAYPAYAGVRLSRWTKEQPVWLVFASGETPIVSVEIFNRANRGKVYIEINPIGHPVVHKNYTGNFAKKTRRKHHPDYRYDKMVICAACQKPLKNSGKGNKGKLGKYYQGYHCDRSCECKKVTGRIPKEKLEQQVSDLLNRIEFNDGLKKRLEEKLIKKYREREAEVVGKAAAMGENVSALKREQESLLLSIGATSSNVVRQGLEKRYEDLERRIGTAIDERDKIEITERDVKAFVRHAKELVEHPVKMLANNSNPQTQAALFDLVFEEVPTYTQIANGTPKMSFIFKLKDSSESVKSPHVIPRGIEPRFPG